MAIHSVEMLEMDQELVNQFRALEFEGEMAFRESELRLCRIARRKPSDMIEHCMQSSIESVAVFIDRDLAVVWGHGPVNRCAGVGTAWMLATPLIEQYKYRFVRHSFGIIQYLMSIYTRLDVLVAARHLESFNWLEWLGFKCELPAFPLFGEPVVLMWKDRR